MKALLIIPAILLSACGGIPTDTPIVQGGIQPNDLKECQTLAQKARPAGTHLLNALAGNHRELNRSNDRYAEVQRMCLRDKGYNAY